MNENQIIEALKTSFQNDEIKRQVLYPDWYQLNIDSGIHSTGFCYAASEVLFRLTGGRDVWHVKCLNDPKNWDNGTHYFLQRKTNKENIDITSDQYTSRGIEIPYEISRGSVFRNISTRARFLARSSGLGELS